MKTLKVLVLNLLTLIPVFLYRQQQKKNLSLFNSHQNHRILMMHTWKQATLYVYHIRKSKHKKIYHYHCEKSSAQTSLSGQRSCLYMLYEKVSTKVIVYRKPTCRFRWKHEVYVNAKFNLVIHFWEKFITRHRVELVFIEPSSSSLHKIDNVQTSLSFSNVVLKTPLTKNLLIKCVVLPLRSIFIEFCKSSCVSHPIWLKTKKDIM